VSGSRAQVPWGIGHARALLFMTSGGLAAVFISWWGASGTGKQNRQITWIVVAILGIVLIGAANFVWLLAGRRAVGARRRVLLDALDGLGRGLAGAADTGAPATTYVGVPGSSRYHLPSCLLVRDKAAVQAVDIRKRTSARPCEMCRP
jgi:hypothetical protein